MNYRFAVFLLVGLMAMLAGTTAASAAWWRDRHPPTAPSNLQVSGTGPSFIELTWSPSWDWPYNFTYRVYRDGVSEPVTVPNNQASYVWGGLEPGETYSFHVEAVDAAGNVSAPSNTATGTTNSEDLPPSAPGQVFVTDTTSTSISLWWYAATDDVGVSSYAIYVDGSPASSVTPTGTTSARVNGLDFATTYDFDVVAVDTAGQEGPPSSVSGTTLGEFDVTPPTAPRSLDAAADTGCGNFLLDWSESRDDFDPQWAIRYDVYMDGNLVDDITGDFFIELHVDIVPGSTHDFYLIAVDTAGNESEPSNIDTATDICNQ